MTFPLAAPLLGHVVPTVVNGFGIVIPGSPIAGFNEYTIGFAASIVGSAISYVVGIRLAAGASS